MLLQWKRPEMRRLVVEALHKAGREDLIGYGKECLIRPLHGGRPEEKQAGERRTGRPAPQAKRQSRASGRPSPGRRRRPR